MLHFNHHNIRGLFTKYKEYYGLDKNSYIESLKTDLVVEASDFYESHKELFRHTLALADYESYAGFNTERNMIVDVTIGKKIVQEEQSLAEALIQLISCVIDKSNDRTEGYVVHDNQMAYIIDNGNDVLMLGILSSADFYSSVFLL